MLYFKCQCYKILNQQKVEIIEKYVQNNAVEIAKAEV